MKSKIIVIEGLDGSGKATQTKILCEKFSALGKKVTKLEFPNYESPAAAPVKMYLDGKFGDKPDDVNAYAASTFFAVDRYASYQMKWKKYYEAGDIILADRYTTSNMVHQAVKLTDAAERDAFLDWLWDFEFQKLGLPVPDLVIFLDMDPAVSDRLIAARAKEKAQEKDIHEKDTSYLHRCHAAYEVLAQKYDWQTIRCSACGAPRTIEEIHADVYAAVKQRFGE